MTGPLRFCTLWEQINAYREGMKLSDILKSEDELLEEVYKDYPISVQDLELIWGIKFDKSNVPEKYREFAKKCLESHKNYIKAEVDEVGYRKQFVEEDAYKAGNSMEDLLIKSVVPDYTNYKVK